MLDRSRQLLSLTHDLSSGDENSLSGLPVSELYLGF
jgi:hypothetical protein